MFGKKETPQEKAERKRIKQLAGNKALATGVICALIGSFVIYTLSNDPNALGNVEGAFVLIFVFTTIPANLFFLPRETAKSQKRIAALAQQRVTAQRQQEEQRKQEQEREARQRVESMQASWQQENAAAEEQKRNDEREDMLKTLSGLHSFLDLYNPADKEHSVRIRQTIAEDLTAMLVKYRRAELTAILEQDETLCGMVADLGEQLKAKGIRSAEATQLLAALPPHQTSFT